MNNYRYYIDNIEVFPINAGAHNFVYTPKNDSALQFDLIVQEEFVFKYDQGSFNFKTQELNDLCTELNFRIDQKCGGAWAVFWEGIFSIIEGNFDDDACTYKIKPRIKEFTVTDLQINIFDDPEQVIEAGVYGISVGGANTNPGYRNYKHARHFDRVIYYVARRSNEKINGFVSDFFQINPVNVSTDCIPGVPNYFKYMVFCALSDIQEPIPSNLSTREYVSFGELMNDLNVLFDVFWFIDSNYNLRIEHSTFFEGTPGIDLTLTQYSNYTRAKNKFTYDLKDYPKKETWSIADHPNIGSLLYSGISNIGKNSAETLKQTSKIRTYYGKNLTNDGVYLFAHDAGAGFGYLSMLCGFYDEATASVSFNSVPTVPKDIYNVVLQYEWLISKINSYNRPSLYAVFEMSRKRDVVICGGIELQSIKPTKIQEQISFPLCCGDAFDIKNQITTPEGVGYIHEAIFNQKNNILKVKLKYKIDNCDNYDPANISDMALWLKKDTGITASGGAVSQWNDISGNARHATQSTSALKPTWAGTGNSVVFSNGGGGGNDQHLKTPAFQLFPSKRGTIFLLSGSNFVSGGDPSYLNDGANFLSTDNVDFDISLSSNRGGPTLGPLLMGARYKAFYLGGALDKFDIPTYAGDPGTYYPQNQQTEDGNISGKFCDGLFVVRRGADTSLYTKQNGIFVTNNPLVIPNTQPANQAIVIGANPNSAAGRFGTVYIKEIIIYDRELTDAEVEQVEFYFIKTGYFNLNFYNT